MIAWGVTYILHSTLLVAAVWLACRFVRSTSARETLWKIALVAPLLTATLQLTVPLRDVIPHAAPARFTLPAAARAEETTAAKPATVTQTESAPLRDRLDVRTLAPSLWAAVAALMLLRLLAGRLLFIRALRDRVELLGEHDRLARLREAMRCRSAIRLAESSAVGSPIAMAGWEIVVPRGGFARLSEEQKETILAHEIAHLLRRDPLWLLAGELIKALLFLQPLNWMAHRKMKECAEYLCDDIAVRQTSNPRALAETLAALASAIAPAPRAVAAMAEGGSNLMARVSRVLAFDGHDERPLRLASRLGMATLAVAALAAFAPMVGIAPPVKAIAAPRDGMHIADGVLSRTFRGPDGMMHTELTAKDLDIADDAAWYRFTSRDGFLRVHQTASKGAVREIDITPTTVHYRVAGVERPWDEEARRVLLSAFNAEDAYAAPPTPPVPATAAIPATASAQSIFVEARQRHADPSRKLKTWSGNVHLTGTRDHLPTTLRVRGSGVRYDDATGEVFFENGATLDVEETVGSETRMFHRDHRQLVWKGAFGDIEVSSWLEKILREQIKMPENVAVMMGRA